MSDATERPKVTDPHDDELLSCFWAQMRHGSPLSEIQARHLFYIGFSAGQLSERAVAAEVVAIMDAGKQVARLWRERFRRSAS